MLESRPAVGLLTVKGGGDVKGRPPLGRAIRGVWVTVPEKSHSWTFENFLIDFNGSKPSNLELIELGAEWINRSSKLAWIIRGKEIKG